MISKNNNEQLLQFKKTVKKNRVLRWLKNTLSIKKDFFAYIKRSVFDSFTVLKNNTKTFYSIPMEIYTIWRNKTNVELSRLKTVESNPIISHIDDLNQLNIACIIDPFSFEMFKYESNFIQLSPQRWREEIDQSEVDMLLIESAWEGKDGLWKNKVSKLSQEIIDILVYCREQGIVTVIWNKEDPIHFDDFIELSQYFDVVFTSDSDCIDKYKSVLGHNNIQLLPFACQPKIHNPIEKYDRKDAFVFAGAYYYTYPKRMKVFEGFVQNLISSFEVDIYDRNYGKNYFLRNFPEEYTPFIKGSLSYDEIDKAYKGYKYAINLNSITESPTMFARRVFELIASNTLVLSNDAKGVKNFFGELVISTNSGEEARKRIQSIQKEPYREQKVKLLALRKVMFHHTAEDRMRLLVKKVFKSDIKRKLPAIMLLSFCKDNAEYTKIMDSYHSQIYAEKKMLLIHDKSVQVDNENTNEIFCKVSTDIEGITEYFKHTDASFVGGMVPEDYYGKNYLMDLALATRYSEVSCIGKKGHFMMDNNMVTLKNADACYKKASVLMARSSIIKKECIDIQALADWYRSLQSFEYKLDDMLCIDHFNYCSNIKNNILTKDNLRLINDIEEIDCGSYDKLL